MTSGAASRLTLESPVTSVETLSPDAWERALVQELGLGTVFTFEELTRYQGKRGDREDQLGT